VRILFWDRVSGKTTECVKEMYANPDAICFVPVWAYREMYPKDLHDRVFSAQSLAWRGTTLTKAIIDDANLIDDSYLREIENLFKIILVTFSPKTPLELWMFKFGFETRLNPFLDEDIPR